MYNNFASVNICDKESLSQKKLARLRNNEVFTNTLARLILDGLQRYDITGLPETCDKRVIKESFLWNGSCFIFEKNDDLISLPGMPTDEYNIYGNPRYAYVYGLQGYNEKISLYIPGGDISDFVRKGFFKVAGKGYNGVFIRENYICFPFINHVIDYAGAISDTIRTLDIVRSNLKQPFVVVAEESIINSVKRFFEQRNENLEYIISSGVFPVDKIKLLPIDVNALALKDATDLIEWYYNRFYELCGVNSNSNPDKKAELTTAEIQANADIVKIQCDKTIECLEEHFDIVNKVFGTQIKVVKKYENAVKSSNLTTDDNNKDDTSVINESEDKENV